VQGRPASSLPVATRENYAAMENFVIEQLSTLKVTTMIYDGSNRLKLMSAQVELASQLLDFGYFRPPFSGLSQAGKLLEALYTIVDRKLPSRSSSNEPTMLQLLRRDTLKLIIALSDLAANTRITHALDAFADIRRRQKDADYVSRLQQLERDIFELPILLTRNSRYTDAVVCVCGGKHEDDPTVQMLNCLLELSVVASNTKDEVAKDPERSALEEDLRNHAIRHLIKHIMQRSSTIASLRSVQILVSAQAQQEIVKVLEGMHRLSTLRMQLFFDDTLAYAEANALISELTKHISVAAHIQSDENIILENQRIMLNEQVHTHILSLLLLPLDRTHTDINVRQPDVAKNHERKELFQACYTFLKALARSFPAAQKQLFCYIERLMLSHIGVLELDVSSTIEEILKDNPMLITRVQDRVLEQIFLTIHKHGRRSRWLLIVS